MSKPIILEYLNEIVSNATNSKQGVFYSLQNVADTFNMIMIRYYIHVKGIPFIVEIEVCLITNNISCYYSYDIIKDNQTRIKHIKSKVEDSNFCTKLLDLINDGINTINLNLEVTTASVNKQHQEKVGGHVAG